MFQDLAVELSQKGSKVLSADTEPAGAIVMSPLPGGHLGGKHVPHLKQFQDEIARFVTETAGLEVISQVPSATEIDSLKVFLFLKVPKNDHKKLEEAKIYDTIEGSAREVQLCQARIGEPRAKHAAIWSRDWGPVTCERTHAHAT